MTSCSHCQGACRAGSQAPSPGSLERKILQSMVASDTQGKKPVRVRDQTRNVSRGRGCLVCLWSEGHAQPGLMALNCLVISFPRFSSFCFPLIQAISCFPRSRQGQHGYTLDSGLLSFCFTGSHRHLVAGPVKCQTGHSARPEGTRTSPDSWLGAW